MSTIILEVNEVQRTLSASGGAFVVHDKEVDIVRFAINSGFADIVLDGQVALRVMYQRPRETEVRAQTLTYYDTDVLHNFYDWQLSQSDLEKNGSLMVALCILDISGGEVSEWHTTPCAVRVLSTIHTDDSDEGDDTITPTVKERVAVLETMIQRVASGAPIVVASTSAMTDTEQIYVLSTDGNWYYHNGSAWVAGGEYGAVSTDTTLTQSGIPADAKTVGDAIASIEPGLSESAKTALLNCFTHVAWVDEHGQDYYDALEVALSSSNYPYTKWSTNPPDDTYGRIYVDANKVIGESNPAPNVPYVNNATDRAAIHTDSNYSTYRIKPTSGVNVEYYAMQLPLGATGFTATFGNTSGTCLYVFKRDNDGYYQVVSSYIRWYTDQEIVTGLDPNSLYIVCGASKYNNSNLSVTIEVTTDGNI